MVEPDNENISVRHQCKLLNVNRSNLFYKKVDREARDAPMIKQIDQIYTKSPFFGSRRITEMLVREGEQVNRKHVIRLMRMMGIEAIYRKPRTSKPTPGHKIYPYLLRNLKIKESDQAWAADITYIPMRTGNLYLVAMIDWHSRFIVSWRLSNSMDTSFCLEALEDALQIGTPQIFNTDQGSQFTSDDFTDAVKSAGALVSMDGRGRYLDNIFVERFWRSLKYEEVYLKAYETIKEARAAIAAWINFYNFERPHQSLEYSTPWEIYQRSKIKQQITSIQIDTMTPAVVSIKTEDDRALTPLTN
jgi:putative transposase